MKKFTTINNTDIFYEVLPDNTSFQPTMRFFIVENDTKKYFQCQYQMLLNTEPFPNSVGEQELKDIAIQELSLEIKKWMNM